MGEPCLIVRGDRLGEPLLADGFDEFSQVLDARYGFRHFVGGDLVVSRIAGLHIGPADAVTDHDLARFSIGIPTTPSSSAKP